jgi:hypothetical protein
VGGIVAGGGVGLCGSCSSRRRTAEAGRCRPDGRHAGTSRPRRRLAPGPDGPHGPRQRAGRDDLPARLRGLRGRTMKTGPDLGLSFLERVTGIEPALSAWESVPSRPVTWPDLRVGLSASDRERPLFTGVNGPLIARPSWSDLHRSPCLLLPPSSSIAASPCCRACGPSLRPRRSGAAMGQRGQPIDWGPPLHVPTRLEAATGAFGTLLKVRRAPRVSSPR